MAPANKTVPIKPPVTTVNGSSNPSVRPNPVADRDDGTSQLLKWGGGTFGMGLFFALLTKTLFGGIGPQGPHTSTGWMALIITMMCLPFGFLLSLLGVLKWLRNLRRN